MAKKAIYKRFNGSTWEEYYFKTSTDMVEGLSDNYALKTYVNSQAKNASLLTTGTIPAARIGSKAITNERMADMTANRIKGRVSTNGTPQDLTKTQILDFLGSSRSSSKFLRGDGTWQTVSASGGEVTKTLVSSYVGETPVVPTPSFQIDLSSISNVETYAFFIISGYFFDAVYAMNFEFSGVINYEADSGFPAYDLSASGGTGGVYYRTSTKKITITHTDQLYYVKYSLYGVK